MPPPAIPTSRPEPVLRSPISPPGCTLHSGILFALYQREKTGRGQFIDVSMLDSIVSWLGYFPHHYWHAGEEPARVGMRHHYVTPYGPYLAGDGEYVNLAVASASDWDVFCRKVIERPELFEDPRFATVEGRRKNRGELEETIEKIFLEKDHNHWLAQLKKAELPYGEVRGIAQVLAHPQVGRAPVDSRSGLARRKSAGDRQCAQDVRQRSAL